MNKGIKMSNDLVTDLESQVTNEINLIVEKFEAIEETSVEIAIRLSELVEGENKKTVGIIYDEFQKRVDVKRSTLSTLKKAGDLYRADERLLSIPYSKVVLLGALDINEDTIEDIKGMTQRDLKKTVKGASENEVIDIKDYSLDNTIKMMKKIVKDYENDDLKLKYKLMGLTFNISVDTRRVYFE